MAISRVVGLVAAACLSCLPLQAQASGEGGLSSLDWLHGPASGVIGARATIDVPEGFAFLGAADTRRMMEMMENIPGDEEYVIAPVDMDWFAVFAFDEIGYVKDDEVLDSDAVLASLRQGNDLANTERRRRGWGTMDILGWKFPPRYDDAVKRLEWATLLKVNSRGTEVTNYNTRFLGRAGVMGVVVVADPEQLDSAVAEFKQIAVGFSYIQGQRYAEFRSGDRIAEYGLAALITGGAVAVATKKGLWKFIGIGVVALLAWLGSLFKRRS